MPADGSRPGAKAPFKLPLHPSQPERVCWGCDKYCPADALVCGNGSERTPHPCELFGEDWYEWVHPGSAERAAALRDEAGLVLDRLCAGRGADRLASSLTVDEEGNVRVLLAVAELAGGDPRDVARQAESALHAVPGIRSVRVDLLSASRAAAPIPPTK